MAQFTGTLEKYDVSTNREDLSDNLFRVEQEETPVLSAIKKTKASNTNHEWSTDSLRAPSSNAAIEGDDASAASTVTPPARFGNYTQILKDKIVISGTQQNGMNTAGISNYMAHEKAKKMIEIKRDCEWSIINGGGTAGIGNAKVVEAANGGAAREMGSLHTYLTSNIDIAGTASAGTGADTLTAGTQRAFTETLLINVLNDCFTNGGKPTMLVMSAGNRTLFNNFAGGSTRYVDTNTSELVHSFDVYKGDHHTLNVISSDIMEDENVFAIDPKYLALADLRPLGAEKLGKSGDNLQQEMVWETTLEVCNNNAHGLIGDLNT